MCDRQVSFEEMSNRYERAGVLMIKFDGKRVGAESIIKAKYTN